jgi:hypothetical protein
MRITVDGAGAKFWKWDEPGNETFVGRYKGTDITFDDKEALKFSNDQGDWLFTQYQILSVKNKLVKGKLYTITYTGTTKTKNGRTVKNFIIDDNE